MALSEEKLCSVGCKWMYTFNRREAKKLIPVKRQQKHLVAPYYPMP